MTKIGRMLVTVLMTVSLLSVPCYGLGFARATPVIVGYGPGGAYDIYGRLISRYMVPNLVVQNMPGVGSIKAANFIYAADDLVFGIISDTAVIDQLIGNPAVRYDMTKFKYIGRLTRTVNVQVTNGATIETAKQRQVLMGVTGVGANGWAIPTLLNKLLGTKFKMIIGYQSSLETMNAMDKKEVEGASTLYFLYKQLKKNYTIMLQDTNIRDIPGVPTMYDLGDNPEDKALFRLYGQTSEVGAALIAPPNMSDEDVKKYRAAFQTMVTNPEFIREFYRLTGEYPHWDTGEQIETIVKGIINSPPALINKLNSVLSQ